MDSVTVNTDTAYPAALDPKVGTLVGTVVGFDQAPTKFAPNVIIVRIQDDDGVVGSLWLSQTVLKSQFARLRPKVGERVEVRYLGLRDGTNGSYHDFRVTAPDRPPFEPNWNALGGELDEDEDYSSGPPLEEEG